MPSFTFSLEPVSPFRLDLTVWALRRLPENRTDRIQGGIYSRVVTVGDNPVEVSLFHSPLQKRPSMYT